MKKAKRAFNFQEKVNEYYSKIAKQELMWVKKTMNLRFTIFVILLYINSRQRSQTPLILRK